MTKQHDDDDKLPGAQPLRGGGGAPVVADGGSAGGRPLVGYHEYQRLLGDGPSFWDALCAWRAATGRDSDQRDIFIDDHTFPRDKTPGRRSPFSRDD